MKSDTQQQRKQAIHQAAYALLKEKGYKSTSMLAIAKRASASNETLYRWYGSKSALFAELVHHNAERAHQLLLVALEENKNPLETLAALGPILLAILTSDQAVALNRAAVTDLTETGTLGQVVAEEGSHRLMPLIIEVFSAAKKQQFLQIDDPQEVAEIYINLLIGDWQIRRVIDVLPKLKQSEIIQRSDKALTLVQRIYANT